MWTFLVWFSSLVSVVFLKSTQIPESDLKTALEVLKQIREQSEKLDFSDNVDIKANPQDFLLNFDSGTIARQVEDEENPQNFLNFNSGTIARQVKDHSIELLPDLNWDMGISGKKFNSLAERETGDETDLHNLFVGGSKKGLDPLSGVLLKSDLEDSSAFKDTMRRALQEFQAKRDLERKRALNRNSAATIKVCVWCDLRCEQQAAALNSNAKEYFGATVDRMNSIVHDGLSTDINFELDFLLTPKVNYDLLWFYDRQVNTEEELITQINTNFWTKPFPGQSESMNDMAMGAGCNVNYLVGSKNDPAWNTITNVKGIAAMFQLCLGSYSTVEMMFRPEETGTLMFHEFGHLSGLYHDGDVSDSYTSMEEHFTEENGALAMCLDDYNSLKDNCHAGDTGCASGSCVMSPTVDGVGMSECSKAYYRMYLCLQRAMPSFYSSQCVGGLPEVP